MLSRYWWTFLCGGGCCLGAPGVLVVSGEGDAGPQDGVDECTEFAHDGAHDGQVALAPRR